MEIKEYLKDSRFCSSLEKLLDSFALLYSQDTDKFKELYDMLPTGVSVFIKRISRENVGEEFEDISDYCNEVFGYYLSEKKKEENILTDEIEKGRYRPFTLRNPNDLESFNKFLDKMIYLLTLSPYHFSNAIIQCPTAYWDKIDDLRETSFKFKRDSNEYISCLEESFFCIFRLCRLQYEPRIRIYR
jgi:hypothetical protein